MKYLQHRLEPTLLRTARVVLVRQMEVGLGPMPKPCDQDYYTRSSFAAPLRAKLAISLISSLVHLEDIRNRTFKIKKSSAEIPTCIPRRHFV